MATPTDPQPPTVYQDNSRASHEETTSDKYTRLENLLRQTLALAGEIAETKKCHEKRSSTVAHPTSPTTPPYLCGCECIVLRKGSAADAVSPPPPPSRHHYASNLPSSPVVITNTTMGGRKKPPSGDDSFDTDPSPVPSPSATFSVQEPFSPGTLALSLDAIVEEKRSDNNIDNNNSNNETFCLDTSSSITSLGGSGRAAASTTAATAGRIPELLTTATASSQPPSPNTLQEYPAPTPSAYGMSSFRSLPSHHRKSSHDGACCEEQHSTASSSAPSRWHVRILPISSPSTGTGGPTTGGNREAVGASPSTPSATSPAYVKLEAVIPYRYAHDSSLASAGLSGEGSYIIIGRPPQDTSGESGQMYSPGPPADCWHQLQTVPDKSLQEYIDEWECPAGPPITDDGGEANPAVGG